MKGNYLIGVYSKTDWNYTISVSFNNNFIA